jgi:hypothetical protein
MNPEKTSKAANNNGTLSVSNKKIMLGDLLLAILLPLLVTISFFLLRLALNFNMDSDPFWSIAVGEWIHVNRAVPFVDLFSWTAYGEAWTSNSWLFCWLIYSADHLLGYHGVALLMLLPCLVTSYLVYFMCRQYHNSTFAILVFITGIALLIMFTVTPRAYVFTFAFVAAILYLVRFKGQSRLIYLIPLIFLLWVNVQTSIRFGLIIILVEALAGTIFFKDRKLWPVVLLSFLATLINPYGIRVWGLNFSSLTVSSLVAPGTQYVAEWLAPNFNDMATLGLYLLMFIFGLLGSFRLRDEIKAGTYYRNKIMILFWFWAALLYSLHTGRAIAYVLLLLPPFFSAYATKADGEKRFLKPVVVILVLIIFLSSVTAAITVFPLVLADGERKPISFVEYLQVNPTLNETTARLIPAGAVDYIQANPASADRIFNSYIFGGYLLLNDIKVFIDARESVFTRLGVTEDNVKLSRLTADPQEIIEKYGIKSFLLSKNTPLEHYLNLHPDWEKRYEDEIAVIFTGTGGSD